MINLDEYYHSYLTDKEKKFCIDGVYESVVSYGYHCDGSDITGHYVLTDNYRLVYDLWRFQIQGKVVEWLMASVLKTDDVRASVGSNPTFSVTQ